LYALNNGSMFFAALSFAGTVADSVLIAASSHEI
jgi:hypothetical protein